MCTDAISKMHEASSCGDDDEDDQSNPRTPETCASAACAAFIASMTDDAVQEMATGLATCTGPYAEYEDRVWGIDGYLRKTASDCGLPSALSPPVLSSCAGAMSKMGEMSSSCGDNDDDDDDDNDQVTVRSVDCVP